MNYFWRGFARGYVMGCTVGIVLLVIYFAAKWLLELSA